MATLTASACQPGVQPKGIRVGLVATSCVYSLAASISAGDVIQMVKVPANATPVYVAVSIPIGIGTANVGDGVSAARYITNYLFSATAVQGVINTAYTPYTYSTDDTIDVTISAVSAGGSATTSAIILTAIFSMNTA